MSLFQGALYLFRTELKRSVSNIFIVLALIVFTLLMCASTYLNLLDASHPTLNDSMHFLSDYMFFLTFGSIGVMITFIYGGGFKRDVLGDRLAYYRSMPISSEHIVLSRILGTLLTACAALLVFFIGNLVGFSLFGNLKLADLSYAYVVHAIVLLAISVLMNYILIWFEVSVSYKIYTIFNIIFIGFILAATITIYAVTSQEKSFLYIIYQFSEDQPVLAVAASIVILVLSTLIAYKVTTAGLKKRNLG